MANPLIAQKAPFPVQVEAGRSYWWCACGRSKTQPFCDGSHKGTYADRGTKTHYTKYGVYNGSSSRPQSEWSNGKFWRK